MMFPQKSFNQLVYVCIVFANNGGIKLRRVAIETRGAPQLPPAIAAMLMHIDNPKTAREEQIAD